MSDVIQFLERIACQPRSAEALRESEIAGFSGEVKQALLSQDQRALVLELGARPTVACMISTPQDDDFVPDELPGDEDEPGEANESLAA